MITVRIDGLDQLRSRLGNQARQIPFATSKALNSIIKKIQVAEKSAMASVFDRPKPQTINATYLKFSSKTNLTAEIGIKQRSNGIPAAEYLHPNIGKSGRQPRNYKRSEFMLSRAGVLPAGLFTVPGMGARLDAYGNMSRGQIVQILSYFRTFGNSSLNSKRLNATDKSRARAQKQQRQYFVIPIADRKTKLYPGIWQETPGRGISPVLMFVSRPTYKAIYDFEGLAEKVLRRTFQQEFDAALAAALSTAR